MFDLYVLASYVNGAQGKTLQTKPCLDYSNANEKLSSLFNASVHFAFPRSWCWHTFTLDPVKYAQAGANKHTALLIITSSSNPKPHPHVHLRADTHTHTSRSPTNKKPFYVMKSHRAIRYIIGESYGYVLHKIHIWGFVRDACVHTDLHFRGY